MKNINIKTIRLLFLSSFALIVLVTTISAAPVVRITSGANAAAIQATVDQFRADLGANNGVGGSFTSGRREINWDGVPDNFASPNAFPANFFNSNSPRGAVFTTPCGNQVFRVSAKQSSGTAVRFGELDASYTNTFTTFSAERLFTNISGTAAPGCNITTVNFYIPGTNIPATVSGFGVVFTDVDTQGFARVTAFDAAGNLMPGTSVQPDVWDGGLSFVGVSYNAGERISQIQIQSGNSRLASGIVDGTNGADVVVMDDFIYGEPRATQYHASDFDGDGISDSAIFRPSTGSWFILNSGSNTFRFEQFGLNGDVPIDGDFDGDSRADLAIFRPSNGTWFFQRSSNGTVLGAQFGQNGDKPVAGDYDKDGKTDIAFWRPSNGNWFILRSKDDFGLFHAFPFGQNGDVPVGQDSNQ